MPIKEIDLFSKQFHQNPYEYYKDIRPHHAFAKVRMFEGHNSSWLAFTYEAAEKVLRDERFIKDMRTVFPGEITDANVPPIGQSMLFVDPPDHRRLRNLVAKGFAPKKIKALSGRIEEIAKEEAQRMGRNKDVDFIEDYAFPIPIRVICELLGVPSEDQHLFQRWSKVLVDIVTEEQYEQSMIEFMAYLESLIHQRRSEPKEDLLTDLILAEEEGERLSVRELYGVVMLLIVAGHETTVNLIANGLLALLTHPEQAQLLKEEPERMGQAIEEFLRYNGPVEFSTDRWARESFTFMGQRVEKGDHVIVSLASADHDSEEFEKPEQFDIKREKSPHLAFGKGIHYCLGAPLARLEAEIAMRVLLEQFPNIRLAVDLSELEWRQSFIIRGLKRFPIKLTSL
ncbi:cytochrome P450 family protein [Alkalihalobacillus pseudalcaliphilus]|uniref:cytochrome P450 family protein n=1 Tax=Alkalihalobacillus pseudalcaliphilus TaxID=79884 RepID=UPI00064DECD3|nr:cytochrome P450 [Alkalihalobacillus pseudalcaliphilus]KMK75228.1 cytochrome P450 [Alkalihalobacillus pseudalcaliphilus]